MNVTKSMSLEIIFVYFLLLAGSYARLTPQPVTTTAQPVQSKDFNVYAYGLHEVLLCSLNQVDTNHDITIYYTISCLANCTDGWSGYFNYKMQTLLEKSTTFTGQPYFTKETIMNSFFDGNQNVDVSFYNYNISTTQEITGTCTYIASSNTNANSTTNTIIGVVTVVGSLLLFFILFVLIVIFCWCREVRGKYKCIGDFCGVCETIYRTVHACLHGTFRAIKAVWDCLPN